MISPPWPPPPAPGPPPAPDRDPRPVPHRRRPRRPHPDRHRELRSQASRSRGLRVRAAGCRPAGRGLGIRWGRRGRGDRRRRRRIGLDARTRDRRRDGHLPGHRRPGGRRQRNIGHLGAPATAASAAGGERRIAGGERARPEPLPAADCPSDQQGVQQNRHRQATVAAAGGREGQLQWAWRARRFLDRHGRHSRRKITSGLGPLLPEGRARGLRTHARGPNLGPRAGLSWTAHAYFLSASRGVKPMICTPAPRATSMASTTSW